MGILYAAVYLAYHKSYFDPRMNTFDLEIAEIEEKILGLKDTKSTLTSVIKTTVDEVRSLDEKELPRTDDEINSPKEAIGKIDLGWWKRPICIIAKRDDVKQACKVLEGAKENKGNLVKKKKELEEKIKKNNKSLAGIAADIKKYEAKLIDKKRDKVRAEVDVKGPLLWLAGILGLT